MANRVTAEEVKQIFTTSLGDDQIDACITAANNIVSTITTTKASPTLGTAELKEVERWLGAHFCAINDPVSLRVAIGESESWHFPASVTTAWGQGLRLTPFGQQAIFFDRTGSLASFGLMHASFRVAPREDSKNFTKNLTKNT
jgi:hypothetical protein